MDQFYIDHFNSSIVRLKVFNVEIVPITSEISIQVLYD